MSITLTLNGSPAPTTFQVGSASTLIALVDGIAPLAVEWEYGLRYGPRTTGTGPITFSPVNAEPYYLHVSATPVSGLVQEQIFVLSATVTGVSTTQVSIQWADPAPSGSGPNGATIAVSGVAPPSSVAWAHYVNGVEVGNGRGLTVNLGRLQPGIHRLFATVLDTAGNTVVGDSSIHVPAAFGLQSAIVPPQPISSSLVYLGSVYSPVLEGQVSLATSLPYPLASFESSVRLIPGSTHFVAELDSLSQGVPDDVIVRTQLGNWTLIGPPNGLVADSLPYDYQHGQPLQPASLDLSARYAVDAWNVHNLTADAFKFRVRFRCFQAGDPVYRYTPCEWSNYSGGHGERQRRFLALATTVDLSLDDETDLNRGDSRSVETFTIPNQGFIIGTMETDGQPDKPTHDEDRFYTDQNTAGIYESVTGRKDVRLRCTYGLASVRPSVSDFSQPGHPRIVNKPKRLGGKLVLYMAGGALTQGTNVNIRIYTGLAPGYVDVVVPIAQNVYNPAYTGYVKAGEVNIAISDYEFSRLGLTMDFTVDETHAGTFAPPADPMMSVGEDFYYTKVNAPAIRVDTACFRDPVLMPTFEGTFLGSAVPLPDCNVLACGPIGTYCYVELASGTGTLLALQPLGYPAPFVAEIGDEAHCYGNPSFMGEYLGSRTTADGLVVGYSGTTGCGAAYQYNPCSSAIQQQIAVVFPLNTTPHAAVSYQGNCYTLIGAAMSLSQLTKLTVADVSPVAGCTDAVCTGSSATGGSVDYIDQKTYQPVTVSFPHMEGNGVPYFAVAPEASSQGYGLTPPGQVSWRLWTNPVIKVMTAAENVDLEMVVTPSNIWRELVVTHQGLRQHYRFYPGLSNATISVQQGDTITLEFANHVNRYKGMQGTISWYKKVPLPYLYDTGTLTFSPTTGTLLALGFCGVSARQDYCYFGTLGGARQEMDLPNPDCVVTVKDNSSLPEMLVVRTKQPHEVDFRFEMPSYNAQQLKSPLIFKFYAGRNRAGRHGEMDVWLSRQNSTFPAFFKVSPFKSLALSATPYRRMTRQTDTSRRGLRVTTTDIADDLMSPRIYVDDRGNRISVMTAPLNDYVFMDSNPNPYTFNGNYDTGISDTVYFNLQGAGGPQLQNLWSVPYRPRGLCYVDSQDEVWAAIPNSNNIAIFSGDGSAMLALLTVGDNPYSVAYSPDLDCVAAVCQVTGIVKLFDASTRNQVGSVDTLAGQFYSSIPTLVSYNPVGKNFYVCGVPQVGFVLNMYEVNPYTSAVRQFLLFPAAISLESLFYCKTTMETIAATESGGSFAFNVNTTISEGLGIPVSTCQGACDAPEIARCLFTNAANPPGDVLMYYNPRTRSVVRTFGYPNPTRATGWHPKRRKFYLSSLSTYFGGPGINIVDVNGKILSTLPNYDWGFNWVYSPISRLMFNTIPQSFFVGSYVGVYT